MREWITTAGPQPPPTEEYHSVREKCVVWAQVWSSDANLTIAVQRGCELRWGGQFNVGGFDESLKAQLNQAARP